MSGTDVPPGGPPPPWPGDPDGSADRPSREDRSAIHWVDERRPRPKRVEGSTTPTVEDWLRRQAPAADRDEAPIPVVDPWAQLDPVPPGPPEGRAAPGSSAAPDSPAAATAPRPPVRGRARKRRDAVEANARLTGTTAAVLLVLLAIEGLTILRVYPLLNLHVFFGMVLIPVVLLKIGSVSWRFARYYLGSPEYRRRGPPPAILRLAGPVVVVLTLLVLFSGVALLLVPHDASARSQLLQVHKASFVLWFLAMVVHVLGHLLETAKLAPRDWYGPTRRQIRGASTRQWLVVVSLVAGVVAGIVMLPYVSTWLAASHPAAPAAFLPVHAASTP